MTVTMTALANFLASAWSAIAPALGDHLWQSTLFAAAAGLLTLALRRNHARARYGLWLAASLKFMFPFALLVEIGRRLPWFERPAETGTALYVTMEQVGQPFTQTAAAAIAPLTPSGEPVLVRLTPLLTLVWLCGFLAVLALWIVRWRRIAVALRESEPMLQGREVELLRRLERVSGIRPIAMRSSRDSLEPGIFGIVRPVLLWPRGISLRLEDSHLEAVLAHELWHVRRRDNLAATLHMLVEAVFWFHPLVWWLGLRLLDERERACDEAVLESGSEKQVYAESILKTCEFCVGSPLACVSGVTGADLKGRIVRIMSEHVAHKLTFGRKLLLSAAALVAVALPIGFGLAGAAPIRAQAADMAGGVSPGYQATVKPNNSTGNMQMVRMMYSPYSFAAQGVSLKTLMEDAYGVQSNQITGGPNWLNSQKYDVQATLDKSAIDALQDATEQQRHAATQRMLQTVLAEQFKLVLHQETRDLPVYDLVVAEGGPKFQESKTAPAADAKRVIAIDSQRVQGKQTFHMGNTELNAMGLSITDLVGLLSRNVGTPVIDKTGLTGHYDLTLHWTPNNDQLAAFPGPGGGDPATGQAVAPTPADPSLVNALQEQLGLQLQPQTAPTEVLVVDSAEQPGS